MSFLPEQDPRKRKRNVTLEDIAAAADVSVATASKALNGRRGVGDRTRERVEATAHRLGYTARQGSSRLKLGGTVGIIASDLSGRFVLPIMMGAEDAFGLGMISVLMCNARGDALRERHHLRALLSRKVDGIIVLGSRSISRPSLGHGFGAPIVYAYSPSDDPNDISVDVDHVYSGQLAARHLMESGASRIAVIGGDPTARSTVERVQGAQVTLDTMDVEVSPLGVLLGEFSEAWGRAACRKILSEDPPTDGFLCGNDQIARGVLDVLRDSGIQVPRHASVVGHDNWQPVAAASRPPLSSIDMNLEELGLRAAELLIQAVDGTAESGHHKVRSRLVVRGTTFLVD